MKKVNLIVVVSIVFFIGCTTQKNVSPFPTISHEAKADLDRPVNCETAKRDIATLEEARASTAKQILAGARSIMPISAVAGILMGDYNDRVEVASGSYNDAIVAKIDRIKARCRIP